MADDKTAAEHAAEERYPMPQPITSRSRTQGQAWAEADRAAFVAGAAWQAEQAAVRRVAPDPEKVARWLYENSDVSTPLTNDEGEITGPRPWEFLSEGSMEHYRSKADALLASGVLGVPAEQRTADRDRLRTIIAVYLPFESPRGLTREQRADEVIDHLSSEAVLVPADQVRAEPTIPWCAECGGPFDGWLQAYGGHWDTCPNRVQPEPKS